MKRRTFLAATAGAALAANAPAYAAQPNSARLGRKALVLVGGVNRGAYQAGIIQSLVEKYGLQDGQPLDYDLICGTSIGALNSYFVTTAQYKLLRDLWLGGISSQRVFRPKNPYGKITDSDSGVLTRLSAAMSLGSGLTSDVTGVMDPVPVHDMLNRYIDPALPVHIPSFIASTNLSRRVGQIFQRRATTPQGLAKQSIDDALLADFPIKAVVATDDMARDVYFASACLPLAFDPIVINGDQFVDGGVTANAPINIAQLCAQTLHIALVDPKQEDVDVQYKDAVEVALGVFSTMQARILLYQVVIAFAAAEHALPMDPYIMRPDKTLPGKVGDFNDQPSLTASWQIGYEDGKRGWQKFEFPLSGLLAPFGVND